MPLFELLPFLYALGLCAAAVLSPTPARRMAALAVAAGLATAVLLIAVYAPLEWRLIAPHVYLLVGYWAPALLVRRNPQAPGLSSFERWLVRTDGALRPWLPAVPLPLAGATELAYLFCYPLVPLAFVLAWSHGSPEALARFWVLVLASGYICYAGLPWLPSRPPRRLGARAPEPRGVRALNALVLGHLSHGWNTFPSGHVAVATAAAIGVWEVWPAAGLLVAALAAAVAIGAAAGRYHFVIDVLAGLLVAAALAVLTGWNLEL